MRYIVQTLTKNEGELVTTFYGLFSFKESAEHAGSKLAENYEVHALQHAGPTSLAEWALAVRVQIEQRYGAHYDVDDDTFYDTIHPDSTEDAPANYAYQGAKLAMQLLQVQ